MLVLGRTTLAAPTLPMLPGSTQLVIFLGSTWATAWAIVTGLPPGSFFVEVDRGRGVALIHVLDARDPEAFREQQQDFYRRYQSKVFP